MKKQKSWVREAYILSATSIPSKKALTYMVKRGEFPAPIKVVGRNRFWSRLEVDGYISNSLAFSSKLHCTSENNKVDLYVKAGGQYTPINLVDIIAEYMSNQAA